MCSDTAIKVRNLSKCFHIYEAPRDRLKQMLLPRVRKLVNKEPKIYYREFWALRDLAFEIKKGETVGVIGRNGSGKSTLLQLLCGTLSPSAGQVETTGRVAALLELGSGFNPEFTGRENVYMNASVLGLSKPEIDKRYESIVEFAGIGEFINQPTKTYSSGMMVRLAFAVIAHVDADILIIDEALAVGDAFFTQKCMRFLRKFMEKGTVLFVSHDTSTVRSLCTRAIWLDGGVLRMDDHPKEVSDAYLQELYASQQDTEITVDKDEKLEASTSLDYRDQRDDFINRSNIRNDIEVFSFPRVVSDFGTGNAIITDVRFCDLDDSPLAWIVGGEEVCLTISAKIESTINSPIIGFFVRDKYGQELFGDNTYLSYHEMNMSCQQGERLNAKFQFRMPRLATGDYSLTVALAEGTPSDHVQHHWLHDALIFRSESTSVTSGVIGVPMRDISLRVCDE